MKTIRVGSRESKLAVIQAEMVMQAIRQAHPDWTVKLVTMKTTGDKILDRTLDKVGGKGLFVKELDIALLEGQVDLTVHSLKDMPMQTDPKLPLVAFSRREDPRDALILPEGVSELDLSRPIGCASLRRRLQLERIFPGVQVEPVRGNVQTRLSKLDSGQYGALILASAGLRRLGLVHRVKSCFAPNEMIPAAGQGVLVVQARAGEDTSYLADFHSQDGADCALAERAFVRALDGGCSSPIAAYAVVEGEGLRLLGLDVWGNRGEISGPRADAERLGGELAQRMKEKGERA